MQQKLLIDRTLLIIIKKIDPRSLDRAATCVGTPHDLTTPTTKGVILDAVRSSARVLRNPCCVSRTSRDGTTPRDGDVMASPPRDNGPVLIGGTTVYPECGTMGGLEILNKHGSTSYVEIRDTQKLDTSIDGNLAEDGDYTTIIRNVIGRELSNDSTTDIYLRCTVEFTSKIVGNKEPNFVHLGLPAFNASDELNPFGNLTTRFRRPTNGSHWSATGHVLEKSQWLE